MTDLAHRYGATSPTRRRLLIGLVALVAVVALAWLAWAAIYQSTPEVRSELVSYDVVDEHSATATLTVVRASASTSATCHFRALSEDHAIVGELARTVTTGAARQDIEVTIRTERRATSVESLGCTAPGQKQRR